MLDLEYRLPQRRHLVTELPGPESARLTERREAAIARGVAPSVPAFATDVNGGIILDADGNSLIDLGSGIAVSTVGASHPRVVAAIQEAATHFTHTCFMVTPYEGYVAVGERLAELTPGSFDKRAALFNSGAEAVENAVKIARHATGKDGVVAFDHAYHGRTNLTLAMTSKRMPYKKGFGPFAGEVYRMPTSYPFRDPEGMSGKQAAERVISQIRTQIGAEELACVVVETIQGEGGFIVPAEGFIPTLVEWCRANDVVFIADEVQAGMCRTGAWFAIEWENVEPDLVCVAKGVAGGMPLSAVVGRAEIMDAVHPGGLGGTYGGNPITCAAALATMDAMAEEDFCGRAREIEQIIREVLEPVAAECAIVGEIRGRGAMMAIEFVQGEGREPHPDATKAIAAACMAQGVAVLTCGTYGNNIRLLPPVAIPEDLLRDGLGVLATAIREQSS